MAQTLRDGMTRTTAGSASHRMRKIFVAAEVALAVVLVVGAGLMLRTIWNLARVDAGFDRSRLVDLRARRCRRSRYQQPQQAQRLLRAAARSPEGDAGRAERGGDDRAAAAPRRERERHRHRELHARRRERPVREHRLLAGRVHALRRDAGHPDRARPRLRAERRAGPAGRAGQRDDGADVLEGRSPIGDRVRPASATSCPGSRSSAS